MAMPMLKITNLLTPAQKIRLGIFSGFMLICALVIFYAISIERPFGEGYKSVEDYGGEFKLKSYDGDIELRDFRGKVVVAYFGFLNCTEACPQAMTIIRGALKKLTSAEKKKLKVLFISVDPERDKLVDLYQFSKYYDDDLVLGLTGTRENIGEVTKKYGVFYELVELEGSALDYTVDHSSRFYMIDGDGELETTMSHSTTPTELAAMIRQMQADLPATSL